MASVKRFLKKVGKAVFPGTGRHAAKRAEKAAANYAAEAAAHTAQLKEKEKRERNRAQKLAIRGLRSRRAASHFAKADNSAATTYGSPTIG